MASARFNLTSDGRDGNHLFQLAVPQLRRQWRWDFSIDNLSIENRNNKIIEIIEIDDR
jgi:hypothetical protein